jgi:hypothetical protein
MENARCRIVQFRFAIAVHLASGKSLTGLCVANLYSLIRRGQLKSIKVGGRRLVTTESLNQLLHSDDPQAELGRQDPHSRKKSVANRRELQE